MPKRTLPTSRVAPARTSIRARRAVAIGTPRTDSPAVTNLTASNNALHHANMRLPQPPAGSTWYGQAFSGSMTDNYRAYMRDEWGWEKRGDVPLFEKLCLEGAQAGLSWATILAKREAYRHAFRGFDIRACAEMTDDDLRYLIEDRSTSGPHAIVRHRGKIEAVRHNARKALEIIAEAPAEVPPHGAFDAFLWAFVGGAPRLNRWSTAKEMPTETDEAIAMAKALKARGFKFVGPKICYSLMQSCGLVVDHPLGTPEWTAASLRLGATEG
jgi:DNA-3-methyladenine glycosylase I